MMRSSILAALAAALSIAAPLPAGAAPAHRRPARDAQASERDDPPPGSPLESVEEEEEPAVETEARATAEETAPDEAAEVAAVDAPDLPPEDVQTFADATLDATPLHFAFNAFGDVSVSGRSPSAGDESATFSLGTFALLINGQLGKSLLGTAEVAFEASEDNEQDVTLERLHLRWQTPHFFAVAGRTHSDLGYWNTAFHHGAWLHLPIARPRALRGEDQGGILPIHWIGAEGGVRMTTGTGALTLAGGIGNGRGHDQESIPLRRDTNDFKAVKLKVEYLGLGWPDLRIGIGGLYDPIAPAPMDLRPALPDARIDEFIASAHAAYRGSQLTLIAEGYSIWHRAVIATFTTTDAFVVVGYRVGRLTPYLQLERTDQHGGVDPFYTPVPDTPTPSTPVDQTELLVGARFDPSVWSALKIEYRLTRADAADGPDHSLALNWSFGI